MDAFNAYFLTAVTIYTVKLNWILRKNRNHSLQLLIWTYIFAITTQSLKRKWVGIEKQLQFKKKNGCVQCMFLDSCHKSRRVKINNRHKSDSKLTFAITNKVLGVCFLSIPRCLSRATSFSARPNNCWLFEVAALCHGGITPHSPVRSVLASCPPVAPLPYPHPACTGKASTRCPEYPTINAGSACTTQTIHVFQNTNTKPTQLQNGNIRVTVDNVDSYPLTVGYGASIQHNHLPSSRLS